MRQLVGEQGLDLVRRQLREQRRRQPYHRAQDPGGEGRRDRVGHAHRDRAGDSHGPAQLIEARLPVGGRVAKRCARAIRAGAARRVGAGTSAPRRAARSATRSRPGNSIPGGTRRSPRSSPAASSTGSKASFNCRCPGRSRNGRGSARARPPWPAGSPCPGVPERRTAALAHGAGGRRPATPATRPARANAPAHRKRGRQAEPGVGERVLNHPGSFPSSPWPGQSFRDRIEFLAGGASSSSARCTSFSAEPENARCMRFLQQRGLHRRLGMDRDEGVAALGFVAAQQAFLGHDRHHLQHGRVGRVLVARRAPRARRARWPARCGSTARAGSPVRLRWGGAWPWLTLRLRSTAPLVLLH